MCNWLPAGERCRMRQLISIVAFSLREAMRANFFIGVAVFAALSILVGGLLGGTPWGDVDQVILSLGWGAITVMALALGTLYTVQGIYRDRDRRTLYMLLARPVTRTQYLLGKFLAMAILLAVSVAAMAGLLWGSVALYGNRTHELREFVLPGLWIWAKAVSLVGYAVAFGISFSYLTALFFTASIYIIGFSLGGALDFVRTRQDAFMELLLSRIYVLFPNYDLVDVVARFVHEMAVPSAAWLVGASLYLIGYGLAALGIAAWFFELRDLE